MRKHPEIPEGPFFGRKVVNVNSEKTRVERTRVIGVCAHVDAGKTTASEAILYHTSRIHRATFVLEVLRYDLAAESVSDTVVDLRRREGRIAVR